MGDLVTGDGASSDQQIIYFLGDQGAVGDVEIPAGCRQNQQPVPINKLREYAYGIVKAGLAAHILLGQLLALEQAPN